jgi:hypothetical protein
MTLVLPLNLNSIEQKIVRDSSVRAGLAYSLGMTGERFTSLSLSMGLR